MDASQYLRRKAEACTEYISRARCTSSGERTSMLGFMASATYKPTIRTPLACEAASVGANSTANQAVKVPVCATALCETFLANRYKVPTQIAGCAFPAEANPDRSDCKDLPCHKGTPVQYREAVRQRVNKEEDRECACEEPVVENGPQ